MTDILTTKITKATKGSDVFITNFVLFVSFVVNKIKGFGAKLLHAGRQWTRSSRWLES
jgi:hypothetical protein